MNEKLNEYLIHQNANLKVDLEMLKEVLSDIKDALWVSKDECSQCRTVFNKIRYVEEYVYKDQNSKT